MKSLKYFFIILATLNLMACAFDKNSNADTQSEIENRNKLNEKYAGITGVYTGVGGVQNVQVSFYTIDVKVGDTASGQPKFQPTLMARYRFLDNPSLDDVVMSATYLPENIGGHSRRSRDRFLRCYRSPLRWLPQAWQ